MSNPLGIPARIRIAGLAHEVKLVASEPDLDNTYNGRFDPQSRRIVVEVGAPRQAEDIRSTLLHELVHGLDIAYRIGLEEKQVLQLERGLVALFADNPTLASVLFPAAGD